MLWVLIRIASPSDSNEYPQHMFLWRTIENYLLIITKYPPYLFYCIETDQTALSAILSASFVCITVWQNHTDQI